MADTDLAYLDAVDVDTLGLKLTELPNVFSGLTADYPLVNLPLRPGVIIGRSIPNVPPRMVMLEGRSSIQTTLALADDIVQTLKDATANRLVEIKFGHSPTRAFYGVRQDFGGGRAYNNQGPTGWAWIRMAFLCDDPYAIDLTPTIRTTGIANERLEIPQGTGPTYCDIYVVNATNPTLTFRKNNGATIQPPSSGTMSWTLTSSTGDYVHVATLDGGRVTKSVSSVITSNMDVLTAGYTWPVFQPGDSNRSANSFATIETTSGTLILVAKRRWE